MSSLIDDVVTDKQDLSVRNVEHESVLFRRFL